MGKYDLGSVKLDFTIKIVVSEIIVRTFNKKIINLCKYFRVIFHLFVPIPLFFFQI